MSTPETEENLSTVVRHVWASRYLSVAGVVVIFYDHLLTLDEEVALIWRAPWKTPKALFLFLRYFVPLTLIVHLYQLCGLGNYGLTDAFCKIWFPISLVMGVTSIAIGNFLVLLHVWNLWERRRFFILWSLLLFIATQIANIVCLVVTLRDLVNHVMFRHDIGLCALTERGIIALLWAPGLCFEIVMFVVVLWNALDRPRTQHTDFTRALYRDGLTYFASLFTLRLTNLLLFSVAPLSLIFLGVFFIWCSTTMTVTRLVLNLRRVTVTKKKRRPVDQDTTVVGDMDDEYCARHRPASSSGDSSCMPMHSLCYENSDPRLSTWDSSETR